uniref:Uncharacterized protein n=1 Tax=Parastrongyloides trichosuri TaxID=131310 RepID=A0A0N4ZV48_PARTI
MKLNIIILLFIIIFINNSQQFILQRFKRQTSEGWDNNAEPGYLPDYRGDKYTDAQRIIDTQTLNKPFFDSIGGEPVYPGGVSPKTETYSLTNSYNTESSTTNYLSNSYSTNNVDTLSYTTDNFPTQVQRDYFVPNTYETSSTNYELLNNGYVSTTTLGPQIQGVINTGSSTSATLLWQLANPGYLPDYRGDKYTDPQRILDTQNLNKQFFESIGGEPVYSGGVSPKQTIVTSEA